MSGKGVLEQWAQGVEIDRRQRCWESWGEDLRGRKERRRAYRRSHLSLGEMGDVVSGLIYPVGDKAVGGSWG